jgi:multiple sugar transport system permease protein
MKADLARAAPVTAPPPPATAPRRLPAARAGRRARTRRTRTGLRLLLLLGAAAVTTFPFAWSLLTSLQDSQTILQLPPRVDLSELTFGNYRRLTELMPFWRIVANSVVVTVVATTAQVVTSAMAGYGLARFPFRGRHALFLAYLATLMVPFQVTIIPLFIAMRWLGWINTLQALIAPMVASGFGVFLFRQYFLQMPRDLEEAAAIDGAGPWRTFWRISLPYARPAIATHAILAFMASWNAFLWPLFVARNAQSMTLPVGLAALHGRWTTDWSLVMAGSVITILPVVIVYAIAQRWIVEGTLLSGIRR